MGEMCNMNAIKLAGVTKQFGDETALQYLDLTVNEGEILGFLGPNGAGKSTTINILLDLVRPDAATVEVLGQVTHEHSIAVRRRTVVLPEAFGVYDRFTACQHVQFAIDSKRLDDDPAAVLERVGLADAVDRKAGGFSTGMKQRLALGMALVGQSDILILDEPSTGLDPNGARKMRTIALAERDRGTPVFVSSHILGQVEAFCDRVGILREGELVVVDCIEALREATGAETTLEIEVSGVPDGALNTVRAVKAVSEAHADGTTITAACDGDKKMAILEALEQTGANVLEFTTREASLADLFTAYTEGREVDV